MKDLAGISPDLCRPRTKLPLRQCRGGSHLVVWMWPGPLPFSSVEDGSIADIIAAAFRPEATLGRDVCKLCTADFMRWAGAATYPN